VVKAARAGIGLGDARRRSIGTVRRLGRFVTLLIGTIEIRAKYTRAGRKKENCVGREIGWAVQGRRCTKAAKR
jgi:hypothetical protein